MKGFFIMFNVVQRHQKSVQAILLLTIAGFALFGIASYLDFSGDAYIAKVGSHKIYSKDLERYNTKDNNDKTSLVMRLVNNQLLIQASQDNHIAITDDQIKQAIMQVPDFLTNKHFDINKYKNFIKYNGISANRIEDIMREQEAVDLWIKFYKDSYFIAPAINEELLNLMSKELTVEQHVFETKDFLDKTTVSDKEVQDYYKNNINRYKIPAISDISYVEIKPDDLKNTISITDEEVESYLKKNQIVATPQYHAAHILFNIGKNATDQEVSTVKHQAEAVLKELKADQNKFAEMAKKYSGDKGSATQGGDLGFFDPNTMVPEFKQKVITMKVGEISDLVKTQFGFHIIKMIAIKPAETIQKEQAKVKLLENKSKDMIKTLVSTTKPDSDTNLAKIANLHSTSVKYGKIVISSSNAMEDFNDSSLQQLIVSNHEDTKKINKIVVNDHAYFIIINKFDPEQQQTLDQVKSHIEDVLKQPKAKNIALKTSNEQIKLLQSNKLSIKFENENKVSLMSGNKDIPQDTIKELFSHGGKAPYFVSGMNNNGDPVIYQVSQITINQQLLEQNKMFMPQLTEQNYMQELALFVNNLKNKYPVTLKLEKI